MSCSCSVLKCPFFTTPIIPFFPYLTPFHAPDKCFLLILSLESYRCDYLLFYFVNAYDCYVQNSASWIMLIHCDFIKIVQDLRSTGVASRVVWREDELSMPVVTCQSQLHTLDANKGLHSTYIYNRISCKGMPLLKD